MNDAEKRSLALAAAHIASEAVAELLRYARHGEYSPAPFGDDVAPIEQLLVAASKAIEIESGRVSFGNRLEVYSAICEHIQGWTG